MKTFVSREECKVWMGFSRGRGHTAGALNQSGGGEGFLKSARLLSSRSAAVAATTQPLLRGFWKGTGM